MYFNNSTVYYFISKYTIIYLSSPLMVGTLDVFLYKNELLRLSRER